MKLTLLSFCLLCSLVLLVNGATQLTGCNSTNYCINEIIRYVCSGDTAASEDTLRWRIRDNNNNIVQSATFDEGQTAVGNDSTIVFANNFRFILTSNGTVGPMVSNLSFTVMESINDYTIQCTVDTTMSCRIMIPDIPALSDPNELDVTSTYVNFSWSASTHPCFKQYTIIRRSAVGANISFAITDATLTSLLLPISQLNNTEYSYSVWTLDTGDRFREPQVMRMLTPNVPLSVTNLMLTQTDYPTDTNETVNITVSWNHPQSSSRPPITQYNVQYNISNGLQTVPTNVTSQTLSGFSVDLVYTVSVEAVNVLGTGTVTSTTIIIRSTSSITPSPSSSPTQPTSASTLGAGAIAGIAIAIILLIVVLVISVIVIVYCVLKKSNDKPDSSVAPQNVESYNYAQVEHSAKSSSSKRQAPPKPPKAHSPPPADDQVFYSAVQKSGASHNAPQGGTVYADLDPGSLSSGKHNQKPKETNQVAYSAVSHNERR